MLDLQPATGVLAGLVGGVSEDQLTAATPCSESSLGDLLDHVDGLSQAFTAAATKTPADGAPSPDAARLGDDWRTRIPERLKELTEAWSDPAAWTGMTRAGGLDLPGELAGVIALDEILVHGWDIAVASGQTFSFEPELVEAAYEFVQTTVSQNPGGTPGLFGPPVPVPDDAPLLHRLLGLTGRNPDWRPSATRG